MELDAQSERKIRFRNLSKIRTQHSNENDNNGKGKIDIVNI